MDIILQGHNAKPICQVPNGLNEICSDISREVIRCDPDDVYCFVADYLDSLLITRENAKIAVAVVQNVVMKSEHIIEILAMTGLRLEEIAAAMPRLREVFRVYLDTLDSQKKTCGCDVDSDVGDDCEMTICDILRETGASYGQVKNAAIKIQSAFRGHWERMSLAKSRGEVCWQRAAVRTVEILRKAGVSRKEAGRAATVIQAVYRGYFTRKNLKLREAQRKEQGWSQLKDTFDLDVWLHMMFERTGLTLDKADKAAIVIQRAYRGYRKRRPSRKTFHGSSEIFSIGRQVTIDTASTVDFTLPIAPSDAGSRGTQEWSFQSSFVDTANTSLRDVSELMDAEESEDTEKEEDKEASKDEPTEPRESTEKTQDQVEEVHNEITPETPRESKDQIEIVPETPRESKDQAEIVSETPRESKDQPGIVSESPRESKDQAEIIPETSREPTIKDEKE